MSLWVLGCGHWVFIAMSNALQNGKVIRFGSYDADLLSQELRKGGIRIKLQPKPFQVLTILLERAGIAVSRSDLKKLLWNPETFVDFDHGLNTAINKIREALNDSAENPRFIETLPNGYRFIADIVNPSTSSEFATSIQAATQASTPPTETAIAEATRLQSRFGAAGIATICLLAAILISFLLKKEAFSRPTAHIKSIAVLPLHNLSGDPAQDYFSDSMTDELITQLAKISSLRIPSAGSVMAYKNTNMPASEIGRALKVDAFVEGSVLRAGDQVRITAQLIDVSTDRHIWAEDYQGEMRNVLVLQANIASAIATRVQANLAPSEKQKFSQPHAVDPRAYDAYIKGRGYWFRSKTFGGQPDDIEKSGEAFRQALQYDPSYAIAYSGLANYYGIKAGFGSMPVAEGWRLSEEASRRALLLDGSMAEAHCSLASKLLYYDWDWAGTEREIQRGLESDPHYAELHNLYSHVLAITGRFDESIAEAHRAEELDPMGERTSVQRALRFSRRYDLFLAEVEKVFSGNPSRIHQERAMVFRVRKEYAREVQEIDQQLRVDGCLACADLLARAYENGGYAGWLMERLSALKKRAETESISPFDFAELYTAMGNADMAMNYLDTAYKEHTYEVARLQLNPMLDPLHNNARYRELVRRIGLPQ